MDRVNFRKSNVDLINEVKSKVINTHYNKSTIIMATKLCELYPIEYLLKASVSNIKHLIVNYHKEVRENELFNK